MKKTLFGLLALVMALVIVSCSDSAQEAAPGEKGAGKKDSAKKGSQVLHLYTWGDYTSMDVVKEFEKEYNCKVQIDTFDSNESMYAKLQSGASGYDVIVPSSYTAKMMFEEGMLEPIDKSQLPNVTKYFDNSYSRLLLDKDFAYAVPYTVSITGIGYNSERIHDFQPSWHMFEREDLKKRTSLLDDQRELIGAALATLGYSVNTTDAKQIDEALVLIAKWKKNIAKFGVDDCKMSLANGEFVMIQTYNGDMLQIISEKPEIRFVIPKEGSTTTFDCFAIMKKSENKQLAHQFIDFMYRTENAVMTMNEIMYVMPHSEAVGKVDAELKSNPAFNLSVEDRARCTPLDYLGDKKVLFDKAWDKVKSEE